MCVGMRIYTSYIQYKLYVLCKSIYNYLSSISSGSKTLQLSEHARRLAVDVHGAAAADALAAAAPEGERGIHLVLDLHQRVEDHRPTGLQVDGVLLQEGLRLLVRVVAVDP